MGKKRENEEIDLIYTCECERHSLALRCPPSMGEVSILAAPREKREMEVWKCGESAKEKGGWEEGVF